MIQHPTVDAALRLEIDDSQNEREEDESYDKNRDVKVGGLFFFLRGSCNLLAL